MDAITTAHDGDIQMIGSTSVRGHQQAATAKGGIEIVVSAGFDACCWPKLTQSSSCAWPPDPARPDRRANARWASSDELLDHIGPETIVLADKVHDADCVRRLIQDQRATLNIPPKSSGRLVPCFSKRFYRDCNLIERFLEEFMMERSFDLRRT